MELAKQVASLESSKRLKELGAVQESLFYWQPPWKDYCGNPPADLGFQVDKFILVDYYHMSFRAGPFSAFTCAELGEMLPTNKVSTLKWFDHWYCEVWDDVVDKKNPVTRIVRDTEAEARAKCLIYLLENDLSPKQEMVQKIDLCEDCGKSRKFEREGKKYKLCADCGLKAITKFLE